MVLAALGSIPASASVTAAAAAAPAPAATTPGTNIGNAALLSGTATGKLTSMLSDDWYVVYPAAIGGSVTVKVKNTTTTSSSCQSMRYAMRDTDGGLVSSGALAPNASDSTPFSRTQSDRYFVELTTSCTPPSGQPIAYSLGPVTGAGGKAPSPATGGTAAGVSIGKPSQPLVGATSYKGTIASSQTDAWYALFKHAGATPATLRIENTTVLGSAPCPSLQGAVRDTNGGVVSAMGLNGNTAATVTIAAAGRYYLELTDGGCAGGGTTYRVEPEPSGQWDTPTPPAPGSAPAGDSIGKPSKPLLGATSYTGTIASGTTDAWYVLYKHADANPATLRIENTTIFGSAPCTSLAAAVRDDNGGVVSAMGLNDNTAATVTIASPGRYFLELTDGGCAGGGTTYRIEPEPRAGWDNPAPLPSETLPSGPTKAQAGGPLTGGVDYEAPLPTGGQKLWSIIDVNGGSAPPAVIDVKDPTSRQLPCSSLLYNVYNSAGNIVSAGGLASNTGAQVRIDTAGRFYLEVDMGTCDPGTSPPPTVDVTITPPSSVRGPLKIITPSLPAGRVGKPYSATLTGTGGVAPYKWSITPSLPSGLGLNAATGAISGTPRTAGRYSLTAQLDDVAHDPPATATYTLTINRELSTTTLSASPSAVLQGQAVTLTATVTGDGSVFPSGTVAFATSAGAITGCTGVALSTTAPFVARCTARFATAAASQVVTATYGGSSNVAGSSGRTTISVSGVRVSAVDFQTGSTTLDVVQDRKGNWSTALSSYVDACGVQDLVEWKDCRPAVADGTADKSWPIVVVRNKRLVLARATFEVGSGSSVNGATVTGTAVLGSKTFTFTGPGQQTGSLLTVSNVVASGAVPDLVGQFTSDGVTNTAMKITWTVTVGSTRFAAGTSQHPTYVVYQPPLDASLLFETLVDLTTRPIQALPASESAAVTAIYTQYQGAQTSPKKPIYRRELDPVLGTVKINTAFPLQYYPNGWTLAGALGGKYDYGCNTTYQILAQGMGRCGSWGPLFQWTLGVQGIASTTSSDIAPNGLQDLPGMPKSPADWAGKGSVYMLVKSWTFLTPTAPSGHRFVDTFRVNPDNTVTPVGTQNFSDVTGVAGQNDPNPPGWFFYGDHVIVFSGGRVFDPSYGTPPLTAKNNRNVCNWAKASLAGFALKPAPAGTSLTVTADNTALTCDPNATSTTP